MSADREQEIFFEVHSGLKREGPGSEETTRRAFSLLQKPERIRRILDLGCGPGAQTLTLAALTRARITAVDTHAPYLRRIEDEVERLGWGDRVQTLEADMSALPAEYAGADLIWSEGAVYNIGFEKGLRYWRSLLPPGGEVALSELCWFREDLPAELEEFWREAYPDIRSRADREAQFREAGYSLSGSFTLPEEDWLVHYYGPIEERLALLRERYRDDAAALAVIAAEEKEIDIYRRYADCFGYLFLVGRRES